MKCFYHPGYHYPLPPEHPFPMDKFPRAAEMIRQARPEVEFVEVAPAPWDLLHRVHRPDYLESVREGRLESAARVRLGLPDNSILLDRCRLETAGTVAAAFAALRDGLACNLAGGTHHAMADRGLGFCVLNDVAVAVAALRQEHPDLHILVVDTDAPQGNGTHALLADDSLSWTYSIHVGRNYPTAKVPGDCDVPLLREASGQLYLDRLRTSLEPLVARVEPDLVFWISGADIHADDRFGQLRLDDAAIAERDAWVLDLCRANAAPTAVLYGGGYNRDRVQPARLHAEAVLAAAARAAAWPAPAHVAG